MLVFLTGCSSSSEAFAYDLTSSVSNLDPLFCTTDAEVQVLSTITEGLLRQLEDGSIVTFGANSYEKTDSGYIFYLRQDATYSDGTPVTAYDYVFTFERMFSTTHPSYYAENYSSISGATTRLAGTDCDIGVVALDDYTLQFTLTDDDYTFLSTLCDVYATPCNEEFFYSTSGKYGTSYSYFLSNGVYYINYSSTTQLTLYSRDDYTGEAGSLFDTVYYYIDSEDTLSNFEDGTTDVIFLDEVLTDSDLYVDENTGICYGLVFSESSSTAYDSRFRQALALSTTINEDSLAEIYHINAGLIPDNFIYDGLTYREQAGEYTTTEDFTTAKSLISSQLSDLGSNSYDKLTILITEDCPISSILSSLSQIWQRELSLFLSIESVTADEYATRYAAGDYDIALVTLEFDLSDPVSTLSEFSFTSSYTSALNSARSAGSTEEFFSLLSAAESIAVDDYYFIPLLTGEYYFYKNELAKDVYLTPSFDIFSLIK